MGHLLAGLTLWLGGFICGVVISCMIHAKYRKVQRQRLRSYIKIYYCHKAAHRRMDAMLESIERSVARFKLIRPARLNVVVKP